MCHLGGGGGENVDFAFIRFWDVLESFHEVLAKSMFWDIIPLKIDIVPAWKNTDVAHQPS